MGFVVLQEQYPTRWDKVLRAAVEILNPASEGSAKKGRCATPEIEHEEPCCQSNCERRMMDASSADAACAWTARRLWRR